MNPVSMAEQLLFTTVRIDTITPSGEQGSGTGFLFSKNEGDKYTPFVVTNKHVVAGVSGGAITFHTGDNGIPNLGKGYRLSIEDWQEAWFGHPDPEVDIAIIPFLPLEQYVKSQGFSLCYRFVSSEMIPSAEALQNLDAIEEVTFIGYPNGVWDKENLLPIVRRGITSTPVAIDFEKKPIFLIDASVFGGSSGSPVFIANNSMFTEKQGGTVIGSRLLFLGVVAAVYFRTEENKVVPLPIPTNLYPGVVVREMIDLGIVFKSRTILEAIDAFISKANS